MIDTCMTSIFSSSWMCRLCGREACFECFEQVKELTVDRPGATQGEIASLQARREKHAHGNPFFLSCTRRNEHQAKDFSPMSRFCKPELEQAIKDMQEVLAQPDLDALETLGLVPTLNGAPHATSSNSSLSDALIIPGVPGNPSMVNNVSSPPNAEPLISTEEAIPFYIIQRFTDAALTDDVFRPIWARGDPFVVTDLLPKFELEWTPEYFMEKYDSQSCLIIECQTDTNKRVTVGEFFSGFGKYEGRKDCWKLKVFQNYLPFSNSSTELLFFSILGLASVDGFQIGVPGALRRLPSCCASTELRAQRWCSKHCFSFPCKYRITRPRYVVPLSYPKII